jgi:biopolymer transport protein ExbD
LSVAGHFEDGDQALSQINVTPLVDVLLVLLLVLMVSASAAVARSLDITLPGAATGSAQSSTLIVRIDARGALWVGEQASSPELLRAELRRLGAPEALSVVLAADGGAQHRHVISVIDVLRSERVTKLAFAVAALDAP